MRETTQYNLIIVCLVLIMIGLTYWTVTDALEPELCATIPPEELTEDIIRLGAWTCIVVFTSYILIQRTGADSNGK